MTEQPGHGPSPRQATAGDESAGRVGSSKDHAAQRSEDKKLPLRATLAASVSRTAAALSRAAGRGDGSVIGGKLGMMIDPDLLAHLAAGRRIALISGTNGKTTTTRFTTAALSTLGEVATNSFGANMPTGHTSALARAGSTPFAVLEVDEHWMPKVIDATGPEVVALLNLSRDQLDRAKEVAMMAQLWRDTFEKHPEIHLVANADDPMVVYAAGKTSNVTWFAAGQRWREDAHVCPACGSHIARDGDEWHCSNGDLSRPDPQWTIDANAVLDPTGKRHELKLQLPGKVNVGNAATALAVAHHLGVDPAVGAPKLAEVASVAGRYAQVERKGRQIRLLLAKNPASWLEAFDMAEDAPTLLAINARDPDGYDTSWLFDVDFSPLRGRQVLITGERAFDLAVRLQVNQVEFSHVPSFTKAVDTVRPGRLEVIANYSAFQDIRAELDHIA